MKRATKEDPEFGVDGEAEERSHQWRGCWRCAGEDRCEENELENTEARISGWMKSFNLVLVGVVRLTGGPDWKENDEDRGFAN